MGRTLCFFKMIVFGCSMEATGLLLVKAATADKRTRWGKQAPTHAVIKTTLERHM